MMIKYFMRQFFAKPSKGNPYNFTQMKNVGVGGIMSTSRGGFLGERVFFWERSKENYRPYKKSVKMVKIGR